MIRRYTAFVAPENVAPAPVYLAVGSQEFVHRAWCGAAGESNVEGPPLINADKLGGGDHPRCGMSKFRPIRLDYHVSIRQERISPATFAPLSFRFLVGNELFS